MKPQFYRVILTAGILTAAAASAQDENPIPPVPLTGLYSLSGVGVGTTEVSMDFAATLFNPADRDIEGSVVLRDPRVAERIWADFGEWTIPARGSIRLSDVARIPRETYESWSRGDAPAIFVNIQNDRGDRASHRVMLSRTPEGR